MTFTHHIKPSGHKTVRRRGPGFAFIRQEIALNGALTISDLTPPMKREQARVALANLVARGELRRIPMGWRKPSVYEHTNKV